MSGNDINLYILNSNCLIRKTNYSPIFIYVELKFRILNYVYKVFYAIFEWF